MRESMKRSLWGRTMLVLTALCLFVPPPASAMSLPKSAPDAEHTIAGKWLRSDGMYLLELGSARKGGTLAASYFNPRPVRVNRAVWQWEQGRIMVVVELNDVKPGSAYLLVYLPEKEKLAGYYYQAARGQTFEVQFRRK